MGNNTKIKKRNCGLFELIYDNKKDDFDVTVEIVDAIMGSGKSTEIFKWIDANPNDKYIYVSPLISEVGEGGRVHREVMHTKFHSPNSDDEYKTKSDDLLSLLKRGLNICCTHSLYLMMTSEHLKEIKDGGYVLIIDEELGVVDSYDYFSKSDLDSLIGFGCVKKQDSDGMLVWVGEDKNFDNKSHKYYKLKRDIMNGILYSAKRADSMLVLQLPIKLFTVAKRVIIITYMFEGNTLSSFLNLKGVKCKLFTEIVLPEVDKSEIRKLINMYEVKGKWKQMEKFKLSNTWYTVNGKGNASSVDIKLIEKFIISFARATGATYKELMYTFPKNRNFEAKKVSTVIKPKGLIDREELGFDDDGKECHKIEKVWIATQTRATNDYAHKTHLVHAFNRYPNIAVKSYFQDYGQPIDQDTFALAELLQWIWRSAIRNGEPINLCILSPRMRELFLDWLNDGGL